VGETGLRVGFLGRPCRPFRSPASGRDIQSKTMRINIQRQKPHYGAAFGILHRPAGFGSSTKPR
jgi:hypothetical protein